MKESDFKRSYNDENLRIKQVRVKADKKIVSQRKCLSEHPFGTSKHAMGMSYLLTRGFKRVNGEFALAFLAYNLKRVINILGIELLLEAIRENQNYLLLLLFIIEKKSRHIRFFFSDLSITCSLRVRATAFKILLDFLASQGDFLLGI